MPLAGKYHDLWSTGTGCCSSSVSCPPPQNSMRATACICLRHVNAGRQSQGKAANFRRTYPARSSRCLAGQSAERRWASWHSGGCIAEHPAGRPQPPAAPPWLCPGPQHLGTSPAAPAACLTAPSWLCKTEEGIMHISYPSMSQFNGSQHCTPCCKLNNAL